MSDEILERLRSICLNYPEATEGGGVGDPSFKVRGKIFALRRQAIAGRRSMCCKAPAGAQDILVHNNPARFFIPPYVARYGWIGIWLDEHADWSEISDLIDTSYRMTAPKSLLARLT